MKTGIIRKKQDRSSRSATPGSAPSGLGNSDVQQRIAARAYELYRERGCRDGHKLDDWLEAEQAILAPEAIPESSGRGIH